jgi:sulfate transport system ATP-binding protein
MYVELKNVNKKFGNFTAAENISFSVPKGSLAGILGPSGSGKTTILRMIAGLETPDSGDIIIDTQKVNELSPNRRGIGFVFQNYALFRHMTVFENIAFGLEIQKNDKTFIKNRVHELIKLVGMEGFENRRPHQLSGGQKQRVAFARALAPNPHLLLLDEPFAAIDAKVRKELREWLKETVKKVGITSIFVTHDQEEAAEAADKIIIVNRGKVEQIGTPAEIYKNPATPFAAKFIGDAVEIENYGNFHGFKIENGFEKALIRPEFVRISKIEDEIYPYASERGTVDGVSFKGRSMEIKVNVRGKSFLAYHSLEEAPIFEGEKVSVLIYKMYLYNNEKVKLIENASLKNEHEFSI